VVTSPELAARILRAVEDQVQFNFADHIADGDLRWIPLFATWLNKERWTDAIEQPRPKLNPAQKAVEECERRLLRDEERRRREAN
jgi:hypothetical protein